MAGGFLMLKRGPDTTELMQDPDAFCLLTQIAYRARRTNTLNRYDLAPGEAMLGDYASYGMTERRYRTAKAKLAKWGFATFRATNRGTIATLCGTSIYDPNIEASDGQSDTQETDKRRTARQASGGEETGKGQSERRTERRTGNRGNPFRDNDLRPEHRSERRTDRHPRDGRKTGRRRTERQASGGEETTNNKENNVNPNNEKNEKKQELGISSPESLGIDVGRLKASVAMKTETLWQTLLQSFPVRSERTTRTFRWAVTYLVTQALLGKPEAEQWLVDAVEWIAIARSNGTTNPAGRWIDQVQEHAGLPKKEHPRERVRVPLEARMAR
jgi:hypothetical protein